MTISTMYPAKASNPKTTLAIQISASATQMTVVDGSVLPSALNLAVLGSDYSVHLTNKTTLGGIQVRPNYEVNGTYPCEGSSTDADKMLFVIGY